MIKAILFDWGDTVMRVLPQYHGAMKDWPKVEAIPGIQDACANLAQRFKLIPSHECHLNPVQQKSMQP